MAANNNNNNINNNNDVKDKEAKQKQHKEKKLIKKHTKRKGLDSWTPKRSKRKKQSSSSSSSAAATVTAVGETGAPKTKDEKNEKDNKDSHQALVNKSKPREHMVGLDPMDICVLDSSLPVEEQRIVVVQLPPFFVSQCACWSDLLQDPDVRKTLDPHDSLTLLPSFAETAKTKIVKLHDIQTHLMHQLVFFWAPGGAKSLQLVLRLHFDTMYLKDNLAQQQANIQKWVTFDSFYNIMTVTRYLGLPLYELVNQWVTSPYAYDSGDTESEDEFEEGFRVRGRVRFLQQILIHHYQEWIGSPKATRGTCFGNNTLARVFEQVSNFYFLDAEISDPDLWDFLPLPVQMQLLSAAHAKIYSEWCNLSTSWEKPPYLKSQAKLNEEKLPGNWAAAISQKSVTYVQKQRDSNLQWTYPREWTVTFSHPKYRRFATYWMQTLINMAEENVYGYDLATHLQWIRQYSACLWKDENGKPPSDLKNEKPSPCYPLLWYTQFDLLYTTYCRYPNELHDAMRWNLLFFCSKTVSKWMESFELFLTQDITPLALFVIDEYRKYETEYKDEAWSTKDHVAQGLLSMETTLRRFVFRPNFHFHFLLPQTFIKIVLYVLQNLWNVKNKKLWLELVRVWNSFDDIEGFAIHQHVWTIMWLHTLIQSPDCPETFTRGNVCRKANDLIQEYLGWQPWTREEIRVVTQNLLRNPGMVPGFGSSLLESPLVVWSSLAPHLFGEEESPMVWSHLWRESSLATSLAPLAARKYHVMRRSDSYQINDIYLSFLTEPCKDEIWEYPALEFCEDSNLREVLLSELPDSNPLKSVNLRMLDASPWFKNNNLLVVWRYVVILNNNQTAQWVHSYSNAVHVASLKHKNLDIAPEVFQYPLKDHKFRRLGTFLPLKDLEPLRPQPLVIPSFGCHEHLTVYFGNYLGHAAPRDVCAHPIRPEDMM